MTRTVIDVCCGAGGLSLGFQRAGYEILCGLDVDDDALETYRENFEHPAYEVDIAETPPSRFATEYGVETGNVDGVVGGPPCQDYSEANHGRDASTDRANLVYDFADYVGHFQPEFFVMENVTGLKTIDDGDTLVDLVAYLESYGYDVDWQVLNAADYGVPQKRKRIFVIGTRGDLDAQPTFPERTHAPRDEIEQSTMVDDGEVAVA